MMRFVGVIIICFFLNTAHALPPGVISSNPVVINASYTWESDFEITLNYNSSHFGLTAIRPPDSCLTKYVTDNVIIFNLGSNLSCVAGWTKKNFYFEEQLYPAMSDVHIESSDGTAVMKYKDIDNKQVSEKINRWCRSQRTMNKNGFVLDFTILAFPNLKPQCRDYKYRFNNGVVMISPFTTTLAPTSIPSTTSSVMSTIDLTSSSAMCVRFPSLTILFGMIICLLFLSRMGKS